MSDDSGIGPAASPGDAREPARPRTHKGQGPTALLVVDVQPDFLPGGRLAVAEGDRILPGIRHLMKSGTFDVQVATQDWHPPAHASFASAHPGREPFEVIQLHGHEQVLWPDHCIQGSPGAELHSALPWTRVDAVIRKGTDPTVDSYSGFRNNWGPGGRRPLTGLEGYLRERGIQRVVVCGLARDYCVRWTAEDAAAAGFDTVMVWDLTRSVDPSGDEALRSELEGAGVHIVNSDTLEIAP
ncbi:MAG: bifunctional nicotinamidase/pyrazinamidase [Gemmatimonadales bacterium]|nr:MAG: bifunctional nicotinamidase/pyrazinamidase [Gemmatimonadales bacterium]